eukprot:NODE_156_length_16689_cov_0.273960.p8 type:complete len:202 gc:universal NODE_156_length_16689_cov_0.273960:6765-7370(+)
MLVLLSLFLSATSKSSRSLASKQSTLSDISNECLSALNLFTKCQTTSTLDYKRTHPNASISIINSTPIYCPICNDQYAAVGQICDTEISNGNPTIFMQYFTCYSINDKYCMNEFESIDNGTVNYSQFDCTNSCHKWLADYYNKFNNTESTTSITQDVIDAGWTTENIKSCLKRIVANNDNGSSVLAVSTINLVLVALFTVK